MANPDCEDGATKFEKGQLYECVEGSWELVAAAAEVASESDGPELYEDIEYEADG